MRIYNKAQDIWQEDIYNKFKIYCNNLSYIYQDKTGPLIIASGDKEMTADMPGDATATATTAHQLQLLPATTAHQLQLLQLQQLTSYNCDSSYNSCTSYSSLTSYYNYSSQTATSATPAAPAITADRIYRIYKTWPQNTAQDMIQAKVARYYTRYGPKILQKI